MILKGCVDGVAYGVLRSNAVGLVCGFFVMFGVALFGVAMQTVFYFDLRVRQEGFDLEATAIALRSDALNANSSLSAETV